MDREAGMSFDLAHEPDEFLQVKALIVAHRRSGKIIAVSQAHAMIQCNVSAVKAAAPFLSGESVRLDIANLVHRIPLVLLCSTL